MAKYKKSERQKLKESLNNPPKPEPPKEAPLDPLTTPKPNVSHRRAGRYHGQPTDQERQIIYSYACYGASDEDIRTIMGMANETLYRHFSEELKEGRATAKSKIAQRLYQIAIGKDEMKNDKGEVIQEARKPNLSALIFLAKTRLGWREVQVIESNEIKTNVQIYIPDNGMKSEIVDAEFTEIEKTNE